MGLESLIILLICLMLPSGLLIYYRPKKKIVSSVFFGMVIGIISWALFTFLM